ncbi:hypothetical protein M404DRAFT_991844, partial [Pisolithus tinctorius Marx 270]
MTKCARGGKSNNLPRRRVRLFGCDAVCGVHREVLAMLRCNSNSAQVQREQGLGASGLEAVGSCHRGEV